MKEAVVGKFAQCGNDYYKSFEVKMGGRTMIFDSFECAARNTGAPLLCMPSIITCLQTRCDQPCDRRG